VNDVPQNSVPISDVLKTLVENQKEENVYLRHYEETRFKITQMTITLSGLLIGALRLGDPQKTSGQLFGIFIIALGFLGTLISIKYTERADRHAELARAYRRMASKLVGQVDGQDMEATRLAAVEKHNKSAPLFHHTRARVFWVGIHVCMMALGGFVVFAYR